MSHSAATRTWAGRLALVDRLKMWKRKAHCVEREGATKPLSPFQRRGARATKPRRRHLGAPHNTAPQRRC